VESHVRGREFVHSLVAAVMSKGRAYGSVLIRLSLGRLGLEMT
jgi:hypothetical protein